MSVHQSDRQLLSELIALGETILARPFGAEPYRAFDLNAIAGDVVTAMRCPSGTARIGVGAGILFTALVAIATGGVATQAELARLAYIAQQALAIVRDQYFAIVAADAAHRRRSFNAGAGA